VPTILGELQRYFCDRTWSVRVPRDPQELTLKVDRAITELTLALQRAPTVGEIAASVAAHEVEVLQALHASGAYRAVSALARLQVSAETHVVSSTSRRRPAA
jgi:RNA polymerase sigma-B factor